MIIIGCPELHHRVTEVVKGTLLNDEVHFHQAAQESAGLASVFSSQDLKDELEEGLAASPLQRPL